MTNKTKTLPVWAIPDIHGEIDLLNNLLSQLRAERAFDPKYSAGVFFLGDLVDRGPSPARVIEMVRFLMDRHPGHVRCLYGNHENFLVQNCRHPIRARGRSECDRYLWNLNGGDTTLRSFDGQIPLDVAEWVESLPSVIHFEEFFFTHAPVLKRHIEEEGWQEDVDNLMWAKTRKDFGDRIASEIDDLANLSEVFGRKTINVCGHQHGLNRGFMSVGPRLNLRTGTFMLDSGAGCWEHAPLIAMDVRNLKILYATKLA